jgi:hypothetical protein
VSIMGKIYQLASEVIVWLGPEKDDSKVAINFIKAQMRSTARSFLPDLSTNTKHMAQLQMILELMKRDYWQRAWIIQEVFQARIITIHCGFDTLSWVDLAKFFRLVEHLVRATNSTKIGELDVIYDTTAFKLTKDRTSKNRDLHNLLEKYRHSLCSDPRDKVFSLCGMSNDNKSLVDYSKSTHDIFRTICGFSNNNPNKEHRVRIAQALQQSLGLSTTWSQWYRLNVFSPKSPLSARLTCTYRHRNLVAEVCPFDTLKEPSVPTWYSKVLRAEHAISCSLEAVS